MNNEEVFYRPLVPEDINEYRRVRVNCLLQYPNNFGTTYEEEVTTTTLKLDPAITHPDAYNFVIGVFNENEILVGFCGFLSEKRQKTKHRGEIVQMYVDTAYSGKGIGKNLLQCIIDKAFSTPLIEQIILSAVSENEKAVALYKQAGFVEYGKLKNYFKSASGYTTQSFFVLEKKSIPKSFS